MGTTTPRRHRDLVLAAAFAAAAFFLVAANNGLGPASSQTAAMDGSGSYNQGAGRTAFYYPLNMTGLAENVTQTNILTVRVADNEHLIVRLTEHGLFVGNRSYIMPGPNGTKVEHEFGGRSFQGYLVSDHGSSASLLIAPEGIYGSIQSKGKIWSFQPEKNQEPSGNGAIIQEVISYARPSNP